MTNPTPSLSTSQPTDCLLLKVTSQNIAWGGHEVCETAAICLAAGSLGWPLPHILTTLYVSPGFWASGDISQSPVGYVYTFVPKTLGYLLQYHFRHLSLTIISYHLVLSSIRPTPTCSLKSKSTRRRVCPITRLLTLEVLPFMAWSWLWGSNMCEERMARWAVFFHLATSLHLMTARK